MPIPKQVYRSLRDAALSALTATSESLLLSLSVSKAIRLAETDGCSIQKKEMSRVYTRLAAQGYIRTVKGSGNKNFCELTDKGRELAKKFEYRNVHLEPKRRWDRRWRIVIFDVPERLRQKRDILRTALTRLGFICLQKSVWVYPHDCTELLVLIRKDLAIYRHVLFIVADSIERERDVAKHFGLEKYV